MAVCPRCAARNRIPIDAPGLPRCAKCHSDLPWLAEANAETFGPAIARSKLPVLVDLWAPWCGPCRAVAPILEALAVERAGSLRVLKLNVDEAPAISARLQVQGIPTMILFDRGEEIAREVGARPADAIRQWLDTSLATSGRS